jgi:gamma-D-glutamyl-L-lysine dipeptidyl-peptidase
MSPTSDLLRVRASVAPLLGEPRIATALTSELLAGHTLRVLGQSGDWWHVEGEDGYAGWTHAGYVEAATGDESDWPVTSGARVRRPDGRERSLPFGARVSPEALVLSGEVFDPDERTLHFPATREALAHTAEQAFTGAPYRWGGVTPWGTDCSGFMQAVARMHGVSLPRDAWQQAAIGHAVEITSAEPADLLFYSDRDDHRITHVAMVLEGGRFVHSALGRGGVRIERWDADDPYVARLRAQCTGARRILPATR